MPARATPTHLSDAAGPESTSGSLDPIGRRAPAVTPDRSGANAIPSGQALALLLLAVAIVALAGTGVWLAQTLLGPWPHPDRLTWPGGALAAAATLLFGWMALVLALRRLQRPTAPVPRLPAPAASAAMPRGPASSALNGARGDSAGVSHAVNPAPGNDLSPAAAPSVLTPAVFRLADALPGRSLVVRRDQVDAAWQLVHVHGLASATSRPAHPADRPGGSDEVPEPITGASTRHSHTLALPYPALDTWLDARPEWFGDSVRSALAGEAETPAAAAASARVLPIDALAAIVWLDPAEALARQADGERESFVYTVSHDLRAPIRVIEGFTRIIKEDHGPALDRIGNDHLDRVLGAAARMTSMIDALLALSRLSTRPLAHDNVDLTALAHQVIDEWRHQAPGRQAEVNIAPGLTVQGDPALLRSVLDNLLGNAWKYCARRELTRIEFGLHTPASERGGLRVFVVRDNGAGFDMRFADKLFGPFQRLHSASEFAGTGVGLASVRRIVRRHGGDVWAEAQVDQGASFYFSLP